MEFPAQTDAEHLSLKHLLSIAGVFIPKKSGFCVGHLWACCMLVLALGWVFNYFLVISGHVLALANLSCWLCHPISYPQYRT